MLGKLGTSVTLTAALLLGAVRLPASPCILSNAPSEKACVSGCCANKSCCETSHQRTGPPAQPLTKAGSDQANIAAIPFTAPIAIFKQFAEESPVFLSADRAAHSLAPLALICIRLI
jgi:hypothetical protein